MGLTDILLIIVLLLVMVNIFISFSRKSDTHTDGLKTEMTKAGLEVSKIDPLIRMEFAGNREEIQKNAKAAREELSASLKDFSEQFTQAITASLKGNEEKTDALVRRFAEHSQALNELLATTSKENRTELANGLRSFEERFTSNVKDFNELQRQKFSDFALKQEQLKTDTETKLEKIRETVELKLKSLQEDNGKRLEEMRNIVDEKLQNTLEKRLNDSFTLISERLELVHKGLGEMQTLASSVGDIKKVMTNVKSRGVLGEYQLANLLEDLLTNEQYERNVKTKTNSGAIVEFAIKMPNNNNLEKTLWLPIDSKFPKEDYEALVDAYDEGDPDTIELLRRSFRSAIIKNAKDIREKYIDPPNTTEYGIMFLPFESLYAEVLRTPGLFEAIQKDYKVTVTGPTTLSALLSSLQMGFRTLAIEKRSSEVWDLLGVVKTEFNRFGTVLEKTKKKLQEATNTIDQAGVRSRAIERQLRKVQELPGSETRKQIETEISDNSMDIAANDADLLPGDE